MKILEHVEEWFHWIFGLALIMYGFNIGSSLGGALLVVVGVYMIFYAIRNYPRKKMGKRK